MPYRQPRSEKGTRLSDEKVVYTITEVMERLQVSRWMVYELIHKRELETILIGRKLRRVPVDALADYIARRREEEAA
jgi:excisionase family DNA binding protein